MKTINGFAIIAHRSYGPAEHDGIVIFGVKEIPYAPGYEYVTGVVSTLDDREWYWGHYTNSLDKAYDDYNKR